MRLLETVQYSAALAVTGAWRGTSRVKIYEELGWETLSHRRWVHRLGLFYKFIHNLSPKYTREPISFRNVAYTFRDSTPLVNIFCNTKHFGNSFYPACIKDWNKLEDHIREELTLPQFKKHLVQLVRPPAKSVFGVFEAPSYEAHFSTSSRTKYSKEAQI